MKRSTTVRDGVIIAIFTAVCVVIMEFLAVNIGQAAPFSSNYMVHAVFSDADGLPTAADVRVSGVEVGKVVEITHDQSQPGETVATLQITDPSVIPLYSNGTATVKPKTLLGEKYVDLTVGDGASSERIPDGGFLPAAQASKDVSNDEIFNAFDARTRAEQQKVFQALDAATFARSGDIQAILPQLTTVVNNLRPFTDVYEKDQPQVDDIFVQLNIILQTLADEHEQLAGLLSNGNVALGAIAEKDQALLTTLQQAANFSSEINTAMAPTIGAQREAIQELAPALQAQNTLLNQIVAPQAACGGQRCGIDEVFTGTLLGNLNYPADQVTVTTPVGELVTDEWASMFSQPTDNTRALGFSFSTHCFISPSKQQITCRPNPV
jgi:phospholipid/cholesterol/gamma-HCH transport system substrate-binding protein